MTKLTAPDAPWIRTVSSALHFPLQQNTT